MGIKGFQGTSLLDYPGKIASLVFFGGCNLTCPFCHNPGLVLDPGQYPDLSVELLIEGLAERRTFIDGVVISGGEPTLDPALSELLRRVKELGLLVKLDTNGLAPRVLERLIDGNLVDYVAIDLKTAPERYPQLHSGPVSLTDLQHSVSLLVGGAVDHEFRTTCVPGFVDQEDIRRIGETLQGARRWVLQQFVPRHALSLQVQGIEPYPPEQLELLASLAAPYAREVSIRGL
ncbi:anaerobic ribonucleoside-triphosphate reductase activating protein [Desulfuromonas soudanensis]|uniref:Anaerobic ribonucleoside-triphosphate reductase activating protein n=1 Tax=Desulfuromonas soudanensis TaxID=1603606 RepID=A0A0M3QF44_9BACT|nr:anaerobic ribonucleoside-triphosphate reductase activating protein [Desulfuromonas soudanensis]ALC15433.1 anaerobic ribonucleoside-triphosphate reductase activating protein [Desulfuromonas soudanensis]